MKKTASGRNKVCAFIRSHVISIAEKEMEGKGSPDIREHLDSCPGCGALVRRFVRAWENADLPEDSQPGPAFFPGLLKRIEAYEESRPARRDFLAMAWKILRPAALAAVLMGGIFAGHEMGKAGKMLPPPEEPAGWRLFDSFDNVPPASVADFYVSRQSSKKEDLK